MHKTLYIDIDEEITSIVDRVRKAEAREIIIVAPKNALLLQGIVNLKLLKKEADRRKKQLMIITQDKVGKKLIEKAGILVQGKTPDDIYIEEEPKEEIYQSQYRKEASKIKQELQKEEREQIGSSDFFTETVPKKISEEHTEEMPKEEPKIKTIEEKKPSLPAPKRKKTAKSQISMSDIVIGQKTPKTKKTKKISISEQKTTKNSALDASESFTRSQIQSDGQPLKVNQVSIKKAEKFFRGSRRLKKDFEITRVGRGAKKYFVLFAGIFALFVGAAAAYFLLPKAILILQVKNQEKSISLDLTADVQVSSANTASKIIPANLEQILKEITEEFDATGTKSGGTKAVGKAVIYNEFSSEEQPLVATTRLENSEGKIFRLTKSVVVPGISRVGNETKPGAIEVDIIADQPGENYNIGPSDFKIPGFKDNPSKYDKFYAKSTRPMTGGSAGETKVVTAQDIASAKEKIAVDGKKVAIEELKNQAKDRKIFDDAVQIDVLSISSSDSADAVKEKFSMTAKVRATALSFQETDVKKIIENNLKEAGTDRNEISFAKPINYILADSDIEQKILKFQAKTDVKTTPSLDLENFKRGILGKTAEDAQAYAKNFLAIEKMDISLWPFFASRIPLREGRVDVEMK